MPKTGFDISTLLDFKPPEYVCYGCGAIYSDRHGFEWEYAKDAGYKLLRILCPNCEYSYPGGEREFWEKMTRIRFDNVLAHSRTLASVVRDQYEHWTRPDGSVVGKTASAILFKSLAQAQSFVHFSTYGIDALWLGAFKMLAQKVTVRGIVSNLDTGFLVSHEIKEYAGETPNLLLNTFGSTFDAPHVKLVVIDGLLAFKGSFNLTYRAVRTKTEMNRDLFEVLTDVDAIREFNNQYFSYTWRCSNAEGSSLPF